MRRVGDQDRIRLERAANEPVATPKEQMNPKGFERLKQSIGSQVKPLCSESAVCRAFALGIDQAGSITRT
jgi:hypothetical protein